MTDATSSQLLAEVVGSSAAQAISPQHLVEVIAQAPAIVASAQAAQHLVEVVAQSAADPLAAVPQFLVEVIVSTTPIGAKLRLSDLQVQTNTGTPPDDHLTLRWSDTRGASWSSPIRKTLGNAGKYETDVSFRRLGMARDRIFELSWSSPSAEALAGVFLTVDIAGT